MYNQGEDKTWWINSLHRHGKSHSFIQGELRSQKTLMIFKHSQLEWFGPYIWKWATPPPSSHTTMILKKYLATHEHDVFPHLHHNLLWGGTEKQKAEITVSWSWERIRLVFNSGSKTSGILQFCRETACNHER